MLKVSQETSEIRERENEQGCQGTHFSARAIPRYELEKLYI